MKKIKKLLTIGLAVFLMLCMNISLVGCNSSPKNGNKNLHGTWYVNQIKYEGTGYHINEYDIKFLDKDYPLTYDCFMLNFLENGKVELHSVHFETLTGELTNFIHDGGLYEKNCRFEFTLGDKSFSGSIEQIGGFMSVDIFMWIKEVGTENKAQFLREKQGYSYEEYQEFNKSIIPLSSEIESQFDLSQEKIWWDSDTNADFTDDKIIICFKKTTTYPELSIEDFNFENAESIEYIALRPTGGKYENAENYTQIAVINLKEKGRDKVIEAVRYFERISIILSAEPNYIYEMD